MATVNVSIRTTLAGAQQTVNGMRGIAKGLTDVAAAANKAGQAMKSFGEGTSRVGRSVSLYVTAPLLAAATAATMIAVRAVESENLFEVSMGNMADQAREFSDEMSKALGVNRYEFRQTMGTVNQMVTSMGLSEDAAYAMSKSVAVLTNDMASFFNLSSEDAFQKIAAGLTGEIEPLKRLGIIVNQAAVENALLTRGLIEQGQELDEVQKVMGRYLAIIDQTANAQGDLARTLDSPANAMRLLNSRIQELSVDIGQAFFPVLLAVTGVIRDQVLPLVQGWLDKFNALTPSGKGVVLAVGALVVAFGPLLIILGQIIQAMAGLVIIMSSPFVLAIGAAVTVVGTFVAAMIAVSTTIQGVGRIVVAVWDGVVAELTQMFADMNVAVFASYEDLINSLRGIDPTGLLDSYLPSERDMAARAGLLTLAAEQAAFDSRGAWRDLSDDIANIWPNALDDANAAFADFTDRIGIGTVDVAQTIEDIGAMIDGLLENTGSAASISAEEIQASYAEMAAELEAAFANYTPALLASSEAADTATEHQETLNDAIAQMNGMVTDMNRAFLDPATRQYLDTIDELNELVAEAYENGEPTLEFWAAYSEAVAAANEELQRQIETNNAAIVGQEEVATAAQEAWDRFSEIVQEAEFQTGSVLLNIKSAFQTMLTDMVKGTKSFSDIFKAFWTSMVDSVLAELARLAANEIFRILFLGESKGGGGGFGGLLGGGGGGGFGGLLSIGASIGSLFATGGASAPLVAGKLVGSMGGMKGGGGGGTIAGLAGLASLFFQTGGSAVVTRPTLVAVGETGPERLSVSPLAGGGGGGAGQSVVFQGINIIDDLSLASFTRRIGRSSAAAARRAI